MKIRVGILQFDIALGDRERNRETLRRSLTSSLTPSELPTAVVIPEIWDVGYALDSSDELADPEGGGNAAFLGEAAREQGVWFVGGSVLASTPKGFVNRAQVIDPQGQVVDYYDKVHLIRLMDEDKHFVPGRRMCRFDLAGVQAGCVICYDIRFCEWVRAYAVRGAEVLFVSAQWPLSRIDHWEALLRARAIENQMFVVACNRCGSTGKTRFGGRSMILGPGGETLFRAGDGEEAAFVEIETGEVAKTRAFLTVFKDRVPDLYAPLSANSSRRD